MKKQRRIPPKGAVRFWAASYGTGLETKKGIVVRVAKTNIPVRRSYIGAILPPKFARAPHALMKDACGTVAWVCIQALSPKQSEIDRIVDSATRMFAHAQRTSTADSFN
jgi:hypothetical protein